MKRHGGLVGTTIVLAALAVPGARAQTPPATALALAATDPVALRAADALVDGMVRAGELRVTAVVDDTLLAGRTHERLTQYHAGVPIFGTDLTRQTAGGLTTSVFGRIYTGISLDPTPTLTADEARAALGAYLGVAIPADREPVLMAWLDDDGVFRLVYRLRGDAPDGPRMALVDAHSGAVVWEQTALRTGDEGLPCVTCAVGRARGVKGDQKKISVRTMAGAFRTYDLLRPARITTYDLAGDWRRTVDIINGRDLPRDGDVGVDADNDWIDGATVDGHVGAGWTYDYLFERFGRRGLDGHDGAIVTIVHPVHRRDLFTVSTEVVSLLHLNAFYCGECGTEGIVVLGEGLPPGFVLSNSGQTVDFFAGALDVVAHELAHGVTRFSSRLIYRNESGALNEAFSDIIGTGIEFFMEETGRHDADRGDYILGEDVIKPGGIRSLADPLAYGDPDHYSLRFRGSADNGGVHTNSAIPGHAFYLAIEGGVNQTSGRRVSGVGPHLRAEMEQVFYRAFTMLMPADATFSVARAATIQSARDMFGGDLAFELAIADAWTAVGVD